MKTVIVLQVGNPIMTANGTGKEIDPGKGTAPVIIETRTFLPIRAVIDELKGTMDWDGSENKVTVKLKDKKVEQIRLPMVLPLLILPRPTQYRRPMASIHPVK